ncbi:hypothetical protein H0E87_018127 [Populus deltoides]|uniref:Uncharacterized protein n=1 Tax=Populus deltoides TaxID=3696 RepID=A0A8T2Y365_POPDE|nr:hypothetical protein H0E87_018127 [Populus deltoides]
MAAKKRERREKTWSRDISVWSFGIWVVNLEDISSKTISSIERLHKMLRLHDNGLAAVERNSIQCLSEGDAASKVGASSETPCCRLLAGGVAFGAIGGGFAAEEQRQCTQEIAMQNVSGVVFLLCLIQVTSHS